MASPEHAPSERLMRAASAERARLLRERERTARRMEVVQNELESLRTAADAIEQQLTLLKGIPHSAPATNADAKAHDDHQEQHLQLLPSRQYLRGADIRVYAVRSLLSRTNPAAPIRYTDWYTHLQASGYDVEGRDPLANFLTQIGRSPVVTRTGERGYYAIDPDAPNTLAARLRDLHRELAGLNEGQQTIAAIEPLESRRAELTTEVIRIERELREALAALEPLAPDQSDSR